MKKINDPKTKLYLTIGIIIFIIIVIWLLNFKKIIQSDVTQQNNNLEQEWQNVNKNFNDILIDFNELKHSFKQPTTTTEKIQNTIKLTPDQLEKTIKNLNLSTSTPSTTDITLPVDEKIN